MDNIKITLDGKPKKGNKYKNEIPVKQIPETDSAQSKRLSIPTLAKTFGTGKDPVKQRTFEDELQLLMEKLAAEEAAKPRPIKEEIIRPRVPIRLELTKRPDPVFPRPVYDIPLCKQKKLEGLQHRMKLERDINFCQWDRILMPSAPAAETMGLVVDIPSPDVSQSKVKIMPDRPQVCPFTGMPDSPRASGLELKRPKSGIFINEKEARGYRPDIESFDLVFGRKPRYPRPGQQKKKRRSGPRKGKRGAKRKRQSKYDGDRIIAEELIEEAMRMGTIGEGEGDGGQEGEGQDLGMEEYLTKMFRRKVSQVSKATSLNSKDLAGFPVYDEEDLEGEPQMTRIVQKFRRDSEADRYKPPQRKIKRGTLESHSYTKLKQPLVRDFYYGLVCGSINQGDAHFGESTRGVQGLCMSVAAYCYASLTHPSKWIELSIDEILDIGDKIMIDGIGLLHMHEDRKELEYYELPKYCFIAEKKVHFQVYEPEIVGLLRSADKKIYNLTKGLQLFFNRHRAGILKTLTFSVAIWKEKHYYFFDARGRNRELLPDDKGKAILAHFYDIPEICTILISNRKLGNWPFTISKLSVLKVVHKDAPDDDKAEKSIQERSDYNILSENKAVIQGSFDLADLCFDFTRNKQAIAMAAVCLAYSRITPPSAWHRSTVDKIMIIGNQLYLELVESEHITEMTLEYLPASFTVGPYLIQIVVYANVCSDLLFRKGVNMLQNKLEKFFETNTMAIIYVDKFVLAIWKQRNMIYLFDPYSRNSEGYKCRNGTGCVSMLANVEVVANIVTANFDNTDYVFYIHAVKLLKIHRDPAQAELFPKTMKMDDIAPEAFKSYKMRKSKKKAVDKKVTADFTETAMKMLMGEDFLEPSLVEIGSDIESINADQMPLMMHKHLSRGMLRAGLLEMENPIDLDSPSLSDTQIDPDRPVPDKDDAVIDLAAWDLTQEELELEGTGEGEEGEGGDGLEAYMAQSQYAEVHAESLETMQSRISAQINTDITVGFLPVPRKILPPTNMRWKQKLKKDRELARKRRDRYLSAGLTEPNITQSMELARESNYIDMPDNSQLLRGKTNVAAFGKDAEFMAPFICMMASAVAVKYDLVTWSPEIIEYTMRSGNRLYKSSKIRYDQVPILDVPRVSLGHSDYSILVQYILDTVMKQSVVEIALEKILFKKHRCGIIVTPSYACAVFARNHLFYLFDCFACNEVGLGVGPSNKGTASMTRYKNIPEMAKRIVHNKTKRDTVEEYEYTRFILSSCEATFIPDIDETIIAKREKSVKKYRPLEMGEGEDEQGDKPEESEEEEEPKEPPQRENKVGYQFNDGILTLQGSVALQGRSVISYSEFKEDHYVCLCVCLMLLNYPILKWDTKRVNYVIERGKQVYGRSELHEITKRRYIRNILIYKHLFDIIVNIFKLSDIYDKQAKNLYSGLEVVFSKHDIILVLFPNSTYVVYKHHDFYHVFDPYPCEPNGSATSDEENGAAGWILFRTLSQATKHMFSQVLSESRSHMFFTFEVTSLKRAPKKTIIDQRIAEYDLDIPPKPEILGKPFHETDTWLEIDPIPWSRIKTTSAKGYVRGKKDNMWYNWDVEIPKDLYSLIGTKHETSVEFDEEIRGKQTIANLIVAIGMVEIYNLSEWTSIILDSILLCGAEYFKDSVKDIDDEDHELDFKDLKPTCTVFPYQFEATAIPIIEGTMFMMRSQQYNLYKALKYFFNRYQCRYGIIICSKSENDPKRFLAFGKVRDLEYFMYDSQCNGYPMFLEQHGVSYILRCKTLRRLLHLLVLTLRGGDFYILEIQIDKFVSLI